MEKIGNPPETCLIKVEIKGPTCYITLNREDKYNALNVEMITELCTILDWTSKRSAGALDTIVDTEGKPYLRTLVIAGSGKHFCAGADVNMMRDAGAKNPEENREDSQRLDRLFNSLWAHPCFTVGSIQGVALGGGAGLVACCDYVVATEDVKIALSEGKLGILPAVIGPYVYRRLGSACFRRLAMQASRIGAQEALRIGFIEQVVSQKENLSNAVTSILDEVHSTGPSAVTLAKQLTLRFDHFEGENEQLRQFTLDFTSKMRGSKEGQEGLTSFLDKRPPNWKEE